MILQREESPGAENSAYLYREFKIKIVCCLPNRGGFVVFIQSGKNWLCSGGSYDKTMDIYSDELSDDIVVQRLRKTGSGGHAGSNTDA